VGGDDGVEAEAVGHRPGHVGGEHGREHEAPAGAAVLVHRHPRVRSDEVVERLGGALARLLQLRDGPSGRASHRGAYGDVGEEGPGAGVEQPVHRLGGADELAAGRVDHGERLGEDRQG